MMSKKLVLGFSTIHADFEGDIKNFCFGLKDYRIVIVIQGEREGRKDLVYNNVHVTVVYSLTRGLSKSRNIACDEKNDHEYIWFLDDDVTLSKESVAGVLKSINEHNAPDILLASIKNQYDRWSYGTGKDMILDINSIVFDRRFSAISIISCLKLHFDECMGIGAKFPSCEELDYIYNAAKRFRASIRSNKEVVVVHPDEFVAIQKKRLYLKGHRYFNKKILSYKYRFWLFSYSYRFVLLKVMELKLLFRVYIFRN